ncbi:MAG TPA: HAMP domain-containing sensor histidine kinase [Actinomycetota bacterium]|nr:HAMP domain-containing sensor histidine kinase [Actinomycetota bacterium]
MRVRGRLMLAFGYLLLVVIVALEVPLAVNLRNRSLAEQRAQETTLAVATAAQAKSLLSKADRDALQRQVRAQAVANRSRVIVVDSHGELIADSSGPDLLGEDYATVDRPEILGALRDGQVSFRIGFSDTLKQQIQAVAAPVTAVDRTTGEPVTVGAVRVTQTTDQISESVRRSVVGLVAIGVGVLAAGLLVAFVLAGSVSRPLRRLAGTAAELGDGRLDARAGDVRGPREVEEVAGSFDEMAARLEATVRAQREFTANASHQLRTPLTGLKLRLETAIEEAPADAADLRRQLEAADREADRLAAIVERLLVLARRVEDGEALTVVDLSAAAQVACERFRGKAGGREMEVRSPGFGPAALALADRGDVDQMLDALLDNALAYAPGRVVIETARSDGQAVMAVEDEGPGIPDDEVERVSERFFRGRNAPEGGSGLGLAIVRDLAERAGGEMVVVGGRERGARIEVRLPGARGTPDEARRTAPEASA